MSSSGLGSRVATYQLSFKPHQLPNKFYYSVCYMYRGVMFASINILVCMLCDLISSGILRWEGNLNVNFGIWAEGNKQIPSKLFVSSLCARTCE